LITWLWRIQLRLLSITLLKIRLGHLRKPLRILLRARLRYLRITLRKLPHLLLLRKVLGISSLRVRHITSRLIDGISLSISLLHRTGTFKLTSIYSRRCSISRVDNAAIRVHLLCSHLTHHLGLHAHNLGLHSHNLRLDASHLRLHHIDWLRVHRIAGHLTISDILLHIGASLLLPTVLMQLTIRGISMLKTGCCNR
jgi:hypothetical protein